MKNKYLISIFALILLAFALLSKIIIFHDTYEYITIAKNLTGINNINVYLTHSIFYPFVLSFFLRIWSSLTMVKIINLSWIFLIGIVLLFWLKNKKAFLIFAFAPIVWYTGIQTTPILPASLFFLLAYIFIKKDYKFYSGLFLGLSFAFYTPMILIGGIFTLVYFWDKKFYEFVKYAIAFTIGMLPSLLLDLYYFGNPFYSIIRYFGASAIRMFGLHSATSSFNILATLTTPLILIVISPFLFRLYKLKFSEYKKEIIFLSLTSLIIIIQSPNLKYFFLIVPIIIILLSEILTDKEIKWHIIISIFLIGFLTFGFFGATNDVLIQNDLDKIIEEYNPDCIIGDFGKANKLAVFLWEDSPKVIWFEEYESSIKNNTILKSYSLGLNKNQRMNTRDILFISAEFRNPYDFNCENYIFVSENSELEGFEKIKCYGVLCVYEI